MGLSGVEPLTSRLSGVRSNHLSYRPGHSASHHPVTSRKDAKSPRNRTLRTSSCNMASCNHLFSLPVPPRPFPRPELLVLLVVELVVQVVVLVEIVQVLLVQLVLVQLVVEVLVQVLVLFEVSELLVAETVAATLERPVRRLTGQHCHPQLGLWLWCERALRLSPPAVLRLLSRPRVPRQLATLCGAQRALAQPDGRRRDLDQLVVLDVFERQLQRHLSRRLQDDHLVRCGRPHVRELLFLGRVHVPVPHPPFPPHPH